MYYTGIGSRDIPAGANFAMLFIGCWLARAGYTMRSGHADGSDLAFEKGVAGVDPSLTEIYLPWKGFKKQDDIEGVNYFTLNDKAFQWAREQLIKSGVMTYFDSMTDINQAFHARNVFQVFGKDKKPSEFVVYYAPLDPKGNVIGGTRTAVNLAKKLGVPTFNLKVQEEALMFMAWLDNKFNGEIKDKVYDIYTEHLGGTY